MCQMVLKKTRQKYIVATCIDPTNSEEALATPLLCSQKEMGRLLANALLAPCTQYRPSS